MMIGKRLLLAGAGALALAACGNSDEPSQDQLAADAESHAADETGHDQSADEEGFIAAAVNSDQRPEADREADANRHPATALAFFGVEPGMTVFEIEAGPGYYTELLSLAVGEGGAVIMQNPQGFRDFAGDQIDARLADGRLANVTESISEFDVFDVADGSIDLATWVQGPHEVYFVPDGATPMEDPSKPYAEIYRILKPGAAFVTIDHVNAPDASIETGGELHRIHASHVIEMAQGAGFVLEAESDFLANPEDDHQSLPWSEGIRGRTDQFALRFRKPE
jgi:predicted methyltransferase